MLLRLVWVEGDPLFQSIKKGAINQNASHYFSETYRGTKKVYENHLNLRNHCMFCGSSSAAGLTHKKSP